MTLSQTGRRSFARMLPNTPAALTDPGRIVNEPFEFDSGLTRKFIPTPAMTLDLAINPDFAQVEADQLVVTANQRFPIFFPEKRPFFLEGIDIFQTPHHGCAHARDCRSGHRGQDYRQNGSQHFWPDGGERQRSGEFQRRRSWSAQLVSRAPLAGSAWSATTNGSSIRTPTSAWLRLKRDIGKENTSACWRPATTSSRSIINCRRYRRTFR